MLKWQTVTTVTLLLWALVLVAGKEKPQPAPFPLNLFAQAKPEDFIGEKECVQCHRPQAQTFAASPHALYVRNPRLPRDKQGCEACHGPGEIHLEEVKDTTRVVSFTKAKPKEIALACLRCHADTMRLAQWQRTVHAQADVSCAECHQIHRGEGQGMAGKGTSDGAPLRQLFATAPEPKALLKAGEVTVCGRCHQREVSEFRLNFHHPLPEGRMVCSDCHDIHPSKATRKKVSAVKEMCVTCHAEKVGPFAFEHDPVAGWTGEGCTECHRPHGSPNPHLLNAFSRGLCNQCHTDKGNDHYPGRSCWEAGCHAAVHGSNSDLLLRQP
ncbi:Cytochrome c-type protein NrfB [bacterium HR17]|uniref:Cytochrome c-type protein NrfB n=1 Tax=Candidatus Fervidibacter japonicus TaxID=2035412 RepID=A0A2H5XEP3_9BACT|nr:Cytochrome c-type protein NrfB [bacterium HR17]